MEALRNHIKELVHKYGSSRESLLPIMQAVVQKEKYLSDFAMVEIAKVLDISAAQVYGTATFYSFISTEPRGKYTIRLCQSITCTMHGKKLILEAVQDALKIKVGETSHNKKFTLLHTNCLGWCHKGPAMLINDEVYTELTPQSARDIINQYLKKE